jgi:TonB family protein
MKARMICFLFLIFALLIYSCRESKNNQSPEELFWNPEMVDTKPEMVTPGEEFTQGLNKALADNNMKLGSGAGEHLFKFRLMINKEGLFNNLEFESYIGSDLRIKQIGFPKINKLIEFLKNVKFTPAKKEGKNVGSFIRIQLSTTTNDKGIIIKPWQLVSVKPANNELIETTKDSVDERDAYTYVDQMPEYPGGTNALLKYIQSKVKYPANAKQNGVEGKVLVQFIVDEKGNVVNPKIIKGIGYGCDEEALRVIKSLTRWKPGKQAGKPVKVKIVIPFSFKLN